MKIASMPCPTCEADVPASQDDCQECGMKIRVTGYLPPAGRLRAGLELMDAGIEHYRQWISGKYPEASEAEIEAMVQVWLLREPEGPPPPGFHVRLTKKAAR